MKKRRVFADLNLEVNGQPAKFTGTGRHMRFEVDEARTLRMLSRVSLPNFQRAGTPFVPTHVPTLLADEGLTLEVADGRGPLFVMGEEARGRGYSVPGVGRVDNVALVNKRAALRLASSSTPSWLWATLGVAVALGVVLAARLAARRDP